MGYYKIEYDGDGVNVAFNILSLEYYAGLPALDSYEMEVYKLIGRSFLNGFVYVDEVPTVANGGHLKKIKQYKIKKYISNLI